MSWSLIFIKSAASSAHTSLALLHGFFSWTNLMHVPEVTLSTHPSRQLPAVVYRVLIKTMNYCNPMTGIHLYIITKKPISKSLSQSYGFMYVIHLIHDELYPGFDDLEYSMTNFKDKIWCQVSYNKQT